LVIVWRTCAATADAPRFRQNSSQPHFSHPAAVLHACVLGNSCRASFRAVGEDFEDSLPKSVDEGVVNLFALLRFARPPPFADFGIVQTFLLGLVNRRFLDNIPWRSYRFRARSISGQLPRARNTSWRAA